MTILPFNETTAEEERYVFPASFAQQRLWFLDQLEPKTATYNIVANFRLHFSLDVAILEQSLNALIERHEVLRTSFIAVNGEPRQVIAPRLTLSLPLVDLSSLPEEQREAELKRLATEAAQHPFDLSQLPLLRTTVLKLRAEEYVLLLTIHHIISDEWSIHLFYQELSTLYEALASGRPSPLADLPLQYADYSAWQQEQAEDELFTEQLAYWKQQLAHLPASLTLPTDRPRPSVPTSQGAAWVAVLPMRLTSALKAMSREEGVTLYMTLVAAFETLLHRYSGQDDIVLGTVAADRGQVETEGLIGFFVNTLVLRTQLSSAWTFRELLGRVREVVLGAHTHQEVPFEYLVKEVQPERTRGQNPLFQVMFTLDPPSGPLVPGWIPDSMLVTTNTAKFDLSLLLNDGPQGLVCRFEYSTALFDAATIARLAGHWQVLLEGIVADPGQSLAQLPLMTEVERQQLLVEWNATAAPYPHDRCLHQLFEEHAERTPEALALVFEKQALTYRELNRRANQVAHALRRLGVGPDVLVGLSMERSLEMIVALLAILKAGGAYVPLDPTYPPERLAFMLQDAQVAVLLTQQRLVGRLPRHDSHLLCLDSDWSSVAQEESNNLPTVTAPRNLAYVIYTSGSTGTPKGVAVEHLQLLNYLNGILARLALPGAASFALISTLAADLGNTMIFPALCTGGCLHVVSQERASDPDALAEYFRLHSIDCLKITPSHLAALLTSSDPKQVLPRLRLILGGEASSRSLIERLLVLAPDCTIINHYGPTETTVGVLTYQVEKGSKSPLSATPPLGRPIANTRVYLLDSQRHLVPIGVPGELYIGGDSLARGYLNRPELTTDRFVPDSFINVPGARLYKTGDLVRYRADGNIEFLGRIDQQVKIRGFRVELGEIEAVLREHPEVREAVVVAREDRAGEKRLMAYIVAVEGRSPSSASLRRKLEEQVPAYMIPAIFMPIEALPLTPNGKVDRRSLPEPKVSEVARQETYVAPILKLHQQLVQIWEELLEVRPIGIQDNFFALGGHSLLIMQSISRIRANLHVEVPLRSFFDAPTVAQLAEVITQLQAQEETPDLPAPGMISRAAYRVQMPSTPVVQKGRQG